MPAVSLTVNGKAVTADVDPRTRPERRHRPSERRGPDLRARAGRIGQGDGRFVAQAVVADLEERLGFAEPRVRRGGPLADRRKARRGVPPEGRVRPPDEPRPLALASAGDGGGARGWRIERVVRPADPLAQLGAGPKRGIDRLLVA